ncbi:MAG: hypothetical protein ACFBSF_05055 [Leptolyngbyaceae cyanobacterium]
MAATASVSARLGGLSASTHGLSYPVGRVGIREILRNGTLMPRIFLWAADFSQQLKVRIGERSL